MSYQRDRDEFISRMAHEGLSLDSILTLLRCATTMQRLAELACSSETADCDRVPCPTARNGGPCLCDEPDQHDKTLPKGWLPGVPRISVKNWNAEQRARAAIPDGWRILTQGDPRGAVLRVVPPGYVERNAGKDIHNQDGVYVPARDSQLRF